MELTFKKMIMEEEVKEEGDKMEEKVLRMMEK